jgi:hypothetical protein
MAAEWEAVDHHHHHATTNTGSTMPPAPSMSHYFYGSGGGGASSSSFNLSFAADDFSIPAVPVKVLLLFSYITLHYTLASYSKSSIHL